MTRKSCQPSRIVHGDKKGSSSAPMMASASRESSEQATTRASRPRPNSDWYEFSNQEIIRQRFLAEVNAIRRRHGLPSLSLNSRLTICAADRNYDEAFNIDDNSDTGSTSGLEQGLRRVEYDFKWASSDCCEGIHVARGPVEGVFGAKSVVRSWMDNNNYRNNVLHEMAEEMGVHGGIGSDRKWYWTQIVAMPKHQ